MPYTPVNIGTAPNDNTGDAPRAAGTKINTMFNEMYSQYDSTNSLHFPAVLRGTVQMHLWPGVNRDALSSGGRQANLIAMQAAIDYAGANQKFLEVIPGRYEIEGTAGIQLKTTYDGSVWKGTQDTQIKQFTNNAPVMQVGGTTVVGSLERASIDGVSLDHGAAQTGLTNGNGLVLGRCFRCDFRNINVGADTNSPYRAIYVFCSVGAEGFFSNVMTNLQASFGLFACIDHTLVGTGNVWINTYMQGGAAEPFAVSQAVLYSPTYSQFGTIFDQLNIEWLSSNVLVQMPSWRDLTFRSVHIEGCALTGASPAFFDLPGCNANIHGLDLLNNRVRTPEITSGSASVIRANEYSSIDISTVTVENDLASAAYTNTIELRMVNDNSTEDQGGATFTARGFRTSGMNGAVALDDETPRATYGAFDSVGRYLGHHSSKMSQAEDIEFQSIDTSLTLYGVYKHTKVWFASGTTANRTVTLSDRKYAPGRTGAAIKRDVGDTVMIVRRGSPPSAFTVTINQFTTTGSVTTTLTTIAASTAATLRYYFDGTNWVAL